MTVEDDSTFLGFRNYILRELKIVPPELHNSRRTVCVRANRPTTKSRHVVNFEEIIDELVSSFSVQVLEGMQFQSLKEEIETIQPCSVLISHEGGEGACNIFLQDNTFLVLIPWYYSIPSREPFFREFSRYKDHCSWFDTVQYDMAREEVMEAGNNVTGIWYKLDVKKMTRLVKSLIVE